MIHHDASTRRINMQGSSNHKESLRSLRLSTRRPVPLNASGNLPRHTFHKHRPLLCLRLGELAAMHKSTALRKAFRNTEQLQAPPRNRCSTQPTCSRVQTCRDNRTVHNINRMAAPVHFMVWDSHLNKRHNQPLTRFHGTLSDLVPRLRHWLLNLEFHSNTTNQSQQVRPPPKWRRRTWRRSISSLHSCRPVPRLRRHTAIP